LEDIVATLAKLTSKNQLTLPAEVVKRFPGVEHFEVSEVAGELRLVPMRSVRIRSQEDIIQDIQQHFGERGLTEKDVADAVKWARKQRQR
jgi:hypothetical protein